MLTYQHNTFDNGLGTAKLVAGLQTVYEGLRKAGLVMVMKVATFLLFLPVGLVLLVLRKRFIKKMKSDLPKLDNSVDYKKFKKSKGELDNLMPTLKRIMVYNAKGSSRVVRFPLIQMQKTSVTLIDYDNWLESSLVKYNERQFNTNLDGFKFLTEKELWANRNHSYEYWM